MKYATPCMVMACLGGCGQSTDLAQAWPGATVYACLNAPSDPSLAVSRELWLPKDGSLAAWVGDEPLYGMRSEDTDGSEIIDLPRDGGMDVLKFDKNTKQATLTQIVFVPSSARAVERTRNFACQREDR